jgi:leucyl aminopeptidase
MNITFRSVAKASTKDDLALVVDSKTTLSKAGLSRAEATFVNAEKKKGLGIVEIVRGKNRVFVVDHSVATNSLPFKLEQHEIWEEMRKSGHALQKLISKYQLKEITLTNYSQDDVAALLVAEGLALSNYQFLKYKKSAKEEAFALRRINIMKGSGTTKQLKDLQAICAAVYHTRDMVNEPLSFLTAPQLSKEIQKLGKEAGFKVTVFNKSKISSLKMGGLLAVNRGSKTPPTFNILEWKPKKPSNKKPIVLVGKGVVFDTGGLSLKPTPNSMVWMKSDMAGAAAVIGAFYAAAKTNLNVHLIGLIPATDNRPGEDAYAPSDVIKMHNGMTVEVMNTDAEGRMILADALSYAKQYDPALVMDLATLTGAAMAAVGHKGIAYMGTADRKVKDGLEEAGRTVYERLVNFPLWKEYDDELRSDIADMKNLGSAYAGQITAGKFLQRFTDYPWIHFDIAPTAYIMAEDQYRGKNGTGTAVRLLFQYLAHNR